MEHIVSLFLFLGIAVWEDYRTQKISNRLILIAFIVAFLEQIRKSGMQSISDSLFHAGMILLILFPLYVCKVFGAGDIKLLAVTAIYLSWPTIVQAFLIGIYLSLIPITISLFFKKQNSIKKISMSGPILGGILIVLCKEGCF